MNKKHKLNIVKCIVSSVLVAALAAATAGCSATTDTSTPSSENDVKSSINSEIPNSSEPEIKEVHLSDDLNFLIESTDEEIIKRCEDPQAELYSNNFIASNGRSYRVTFTFCSGIALGLYAPIEMLLPEKSFYTFGELYDLFGDKMKIYYLEPKFPMTEGGLRIYTEIDGKTVYFLVEPDNNDNSRGDYALPFNSEVIFKGIAIDGTYVTDHRDYM